MYPFRSFPLFFAVSFLFILSSCEKPITDPDTPVSSLSSSSDPSPNVFLSFSPYSQSSFTRASLSDCCTRLSVALFNPDGSKVKSFNQKSTDADFGSASLTLSAGTYTLVAIAHSSTEGNATISSPQKATFASNKITDTFSFCGSLVVGEEQFSKSIILSRVVSLFRITLSDATIPANIQQLKFYYTGGSSTLNPTTGFGCVNSKQTEYRPTHDDNGLAISTYDLYTFPHEQSDLLKLTITALTSEGTPISEWTFTDIPITLNKITTWSGSLFDNTPDDPNDDDGDDEGGTAFQQGTALFSINSDWSGTTTYTF